jgi:hypothetical protein
MPVDAATKYLAAYRSGSLEWGPFKVGPDIIEGIRRIKAIDGPGLNPRGQFDSDIDAARRGADQILLVVCPILSDKENVCVRQNLAKRTRTDQHESCVLWRPHQHQRACLRTGPQGRSGLSECRSCSFTGSLRFWFASEFRSVVKTETCPRRD